MGTEIDDIKLSTPIFVTHSDDNPSDVGGSWNDGFGNNQGYLISFTEDMAEFKGIQTYLGLVGGKFNNSEDGESNLFGVVGGLKKEFGYHVEGHIEAIVGAVDGYGHTDENRDKLTTAVIFGAGVSRKFNDFSIGMDVGILPGKTLSDAPADAYVVNATISHSF